MDLKAKGISSKGLIRLFAHYGRKRSGIMRIARLLCVDEQTVIEAGVAAGIFKKERKNLPLEKKPPKKLHPCTGCVWGTFVERDRYYCFSPSCLKGGKKQ